METEMGVKKCIKLYHNHGLRVTQLNTNNEFTCIEESIRLVRLNEVTADEHVGEVEWSTRTVKEGNHCRIQMCAYKR